MCLQIRVEYLNKRCIKLDIKAETKGRHIAPDKNRCKGRSQVKTPTHHRQTQTEQRSGRSLELQNRLMNLYCHD